MRTFSPIFALCILFFASFAAAEPSTDNLLTNGDLSAGAKQWRFIANNQEESLRQGIQSSPEVGPFLYITSTKRVDLPVWWAQEVPAKPMTRYSLTCMARGFSSDTSADRAVIIGVYFQGADGKWLGYKVLSLVATQQAKHPEGTVPDTPQWKEYASDFTSPANTTKLGVRFDLMYGPAQAGFARIRLQSSDTIANGGFEAWNTYSPVEGKIHPNFANDLAPTNWRFAVECPELQTNPSFPVATTVSRDSQIKHSGSYALKIHNDRLTDYLVAYASEFDVAPGSKYKIRLWYKAEDIVRNGRDGEGITIALAEAEENIALKNTTTVIRPKTRDGTFDWRMIEMRFSTKPTSRKAALNLQLRRAKGTAWFDDVQVIAEEQPTTDQ